MKSEGDLSTVAAYIDLTAVRSSHLLTSPACFAAPAALRLGSPACFATPAALRHCGWVHGVSLAHLPTSKRVYHEIRSYPALLVCPYGSCTSAIGMLKEAVASLFADNNKSEAA
jgi:hypothetical protein